MSGSRRKQLAKQGATTRAKRREARKPHERKRKSEYTGRLNASKIPATKKDWPGKRKRRPSWPDVRLTQLDEACEFSTDRAISDPVQLVCELKKHPQYLQPMRDAVDPLLRAEREQKTRMGRKRRQGDWVLLYLAFVMSGDPSRLSFWNRYASSPIWHECGFDESPEYEILRIRFNEMEKAWEGFREASRMAVRQAVRHDPEIADFWMVDSTGWQTPASLEHCCVDRNACRELLIKQGRLKPYEKKAKQDTTVDEDAPADPAAVERAEEADDDYLELRGRGMAERLRRAHYDAIEAERHKEQAEEELEPGEEPPSVVHPVDEDEEFQYFVINGHRYRSRDKTSGLRHYSSGKGRTWFGGYGNPALSLKYGAPLAVEAFAADDQEWDHYPDLFDSTVAATGVVPLAVSADKGYASRDVYEFNTRRGVGTVAPFRQAGGFKMREDMRSHAVDEHGIPRCEHCGGEGDPHRPGLSFYLDKKGEPRIRFYCKVPASPLCLKEQSRACEEEWRLLQPLDLTQPIYHALREMHFTFERIFGHWRQRYGVFGKDGSSRLRRKGVPAQRLRAQAAVFLDWFRICLRHGFLGTWRTRNTQAAADITSKGGKRLANVLRSRRRRGLDLPYGAAAERLRLWRERTNAPPLVVDDELPEGF